MRSAVATAAVVGLVAVPASLATAGGSGHAKVKHHTTTTLKSKALDRAVAQHLAALEACDADALVAGYTDDAKLFFPDGVVVTGRAALQSLYDGFVKPQADGGLCGLKATPVETFRRGFTVFVKFEVTAPFLAESYFSTDGYVFKGKKIASEISTFDASKLKFK
jgi:hypothetical protein